MTLRSYRISALRLPILPASATLVPALLVLGAALLAPGAQAQNHPTGADAESPYGGITVEGILARVNDQVITRSDYDRALKEMDDQARQRGENLQQIADGHKDLLRDLIDQQLWLSKGKEMGITADTELVKQLDEIRKKYNLASMDDLEKAARDQGVSFEDFKANIRNQIITSQVIREEVGRKLSITPGEVQRYFEAHKQEYAQPESVHLSEILVSPGGPTDTAAADDPQKLAAAKAKADDIEAKLKAGGNFDQIARSSSDGQTATEGGELGTYERGKLNKVFEDQTFSLKSGDFTEPIHTKQGYVILKVVAHNPGGVPQYKDVEQQVEDTYFESRMAPAVRTYLTTLREESYVDIKPGYVDSGASAKETKPVYSAYTPPAPKKKKKVQRTRFRETEHGFRNKPKPALVPVAADTTPAKPAAKAATATPATMKPGKKEKIRFGQAPRETLPNTTETKVEDAGAVPKDAAAGATEEADNSTQPAAPVKKTRFSARATLPKAAKSKGPQLDNFTPAPPDSGEVADRQTQSAPLGLAGDTTKKPKKKSGNASTGQKTRMTERPKEETTKTPVELTPAAPVPGAPAPATAPKTTSPAPSSAPQQTPASPDPPQSDTPASEPPK
jgi:peptidyl-prolyl cis-trans isomerase SurA